MFINLIKFERKTIRNSISLILLIYLICFKIYLFYHLSILILILVISWLFFHFIGTVLTDKGLTNGLLVILAIFNIKILIIISTVQNCCTIFALELFELFLIALSIFLGLIQIGFSVTIIDLFPLFRNQFSKL